MNSEKKQKWVEALRSGEFTQSNSALRKNGKHCCLGVLCEIHSKETGNAWVQDPDGVGDKYLNNPCTLPEEVVAWAGLTESDPFISIGGRERRLATINDRGVPFSMIADLIEEQF